MTRGATVPLAPLVAAVLAVLFHPSTARGQDRVGPQGVAQARVDRPYEAPLFDETPVLPPLPPEYLEHDQTGIRFAYHPSARERVRTLIDESDEIRSALSVMLGETVLSSIDVRIAVGSGDFERVVPPGTPRGAGPVAISQARLLVMALRSGPTATSEVVAAFRRGLAHLALDEIAGFDHLPRWVRVGFALNFADDGWLQRSRALWWASLDQRLLPLVDLDHHLLDRGDHQSVAAAEAADFVAFLLRSEHDGAWPLFVRASREEAFGDAVHDAYQHDADSLEVEWREDVAKHKAFLPILAASTGLWMLVAAAARVRRRLRAKKDAAAEEARAARKAARPKFVRASKSKRRRAPVTQIPEPEVPKVSHNGRWHTLH